MLFKSSIAVAVGGASLALAGNPDKPEISPAFDRGRFETDLRNNLHPTQSTWDYWGEGWIPQGCKDIATSHGLNPFDFTIFNVHYTDCSEPWLFCRHKDAGASEIDMIDMFGRMPVHMRSYIRYVKPNAFYVTFSPSYMLDPVTWWQLLASMMARQRSRTPPATVSWKVPRD